MTKLLGVYPLESDPKKLGKFDFPHYRVSRDGLFLRGKNLLGEYWIKQKYFPAHLESMGDWDKGHFTFNAPRIPKEIVGPVLDFFRKVYEKDHTEAEVLLLYNATTKQYKVFVPWQICTGASVHSLYDPGEIENEWVVIGSIHSHCNFGAFHSGTDTADASVFNGLHVTIGHVNTNNPSWAVMVMINEQEFEFKDDEDVLEIENLDALDEFTAPDEWFAFIKEHVHEIVVQNFKTLGKEQLDAFERSTRFSLTSTKDDDKKKKGVSSLPKWDDSDDWDNWRSWTKKPDDKAIDNWRSGNPNWMSGPGYLSTRFNEQLRKSLPSELLDVKNNILPEHIVEVLTKELEKLYNVAEDYGYILDYRFFDIVQTNDDKDIPLEVRKENFTGEGHLPDGSIIKLGSSDIPIRVFDGNNNLVSESSVSLDDMDEDIRELRALDDINDYSGEEGFFRAINKIVDENDDQDVIDRAIARLVNMED